MTFPKAEQREQGAKGNGVGFPVIKIIYFFSQKLRSSQIYTMSLLRPYQIATVNTDFMSRNLGIAEDIKKTEHLYEAMSDPGGYVESRKIRLEKIAEKLAKGYDKKYKELAAQGLSDKKIVKLLSEITESLYSIEKAIIDNEYAESDQLLFKKFDKNSYSGKMTKPYPKTLDAGALELEKLERKQERLSKIMDQLKAKTITSS